MVLRRLTLRRICAASIAASAALYLASPYIALWSMGRALARHDDVALCAALDWGQVRDALKQSLGAASGVQPVNQQQDELPGFGESFATGVASGTIDAEITPQSLDTMLAALSGAPLPHGPARDGSPHGSFHGLTSFEAEIPLPDGAPVAISMQIEEWRWKVTRISLPQGPRPPASRTAGTVRAAART